MEETFRLLIQGDNNIRLPGRLLNILDGREGDEVRIVTEHGKVKSVELFTGEHGGAPQAAADEESQSRFEEIQNGKTDSWEVLKAELEKPEELVACP